MLPPGLDLAAQDVMGSNRHPIVLILGRQSGVRSRLLPFGADYLEFILALPFVERRAGREGSAGLSATPPGSISTAACRPWRGGCCTPTTSGARRSGDRRQLPHRGAGRREVAAGRALPHRRPGDRAGPPWRADAARAAGDLSLRGGGWRYSVADLGLDRAVLQPVGLGLSIHRAFVPGLPVGDFRLEGADGDAGSAFRIRTHWRLAAPGRGARLRDRSARRHKPVPEPGATAAGLDNGRRKR